MTGHKALKGAVAGLAMLAGSQAMAQEEITVAYFLEWPMPFEYAKVTGAYDEALGVKVNWRALPSGHRSSLSRVGAPRQQRR